jgi:hypothetical protein
MPSRRKFSARACPAKHSDGSGRRLCRSRSKSSARAPAYATRTRACRSASAWSTKRAAPLFTIAVGVEDRRGQRAIGYGVDLLALPLVRRAPRARASPTTAPICCARWRRAGRAGARTGVPLRRGNPAAARGRARRVYARQGRRLPGRRQQDHRPCLGLRDGNRLPHAQSAGRGAFLGAGVYYGAGASEAELCGREHAVVVGAATRRLRRRSISPAMPPR